MCFSFGFKVTRKPQLFHRRAHMKKFGELMFGFSNHGLFISPSSSQKHTSFCNPGLPHITLPSIYPINYGEVCDQIVPWCIHSRRLLHMYTIKVTWAFSDFWILGTASFLMLKAMYKHTICAHTSLPPGRGRVWEQRPTPRQSLNGVCGSCRVLSTFQKQNIYI